MATGVACSRQLCGRKVYYAEKGGKTVRGIVGRKEMERSSSSKSVGGARCCADNKKTEKGRNSSIEGSREGVRGPKVAFT